MTTSTPPATIPTVTRVRGWVLVVLGVSLAAGLLLTLTHMLPTMLNPGKPVDGSTFTGSAQLGGLVIAVLGWLCLLGLAFAAGGVFLLRQGRFPRAFVVVLVLMIAVALGGVFRLKELLV